MAVTETLTSRVRDAVARYGSLRRYGQVELRLRRAVLNNSIYHADEQLLVGQHAYGIPAGRAPVLYLRRAGRGDMATTYLESFEQVWGGARQVPR